MGRQGHTQLLLGGLHLPGDVAKVGKTICLIAPKREQCIDRFTPGHLVDVQYGLNSTRVSLNWTETARFRARGAGGEPLCGTVRTVVPTTRDHASGC